MGRVAQGEAEDNTSCSQLQGEYVPIHAEPLQYFRPERGKLRKEHLPVNDADLSCFIQKTPTPLNYYG